MRFIRKLTRPRMRGGARSGSDVSAHLAWIDPPLQRSVGKRGYPLIRRSANTRRQITWVTGDRHRRAHARGGIEGRKRAVYARGGLIGTAHGNDADIHVHAARP